MNDQPTDGTVRDNIRLALPSKGRLAEEALAFLERCGMRVYRPNERQYIATIPALPGVEVILQRPGDIAIGVRQGSLDFGITGLDILQEYVAGQAQRVLVLHDALGFGKCTLNIAAPNELPVQTLDDLRRFVAARAADGRPARIATKYPHLTAAFLDRHTIAPYRLINAEGTLEIAPRIGYADLIVDLVSSGMTLRDNHLHPLSDGEIMRSQAVLVANRDALRNRPTVHQTARILLEYIEAHLRAEESMMVIANMRGPSAEAVARRMFDHPELAGLRGPTIAPVFSANPEGHNWFSVSIAVRKRDLAVTIAALRAIGGSGVIVTPAIYIFEEEPLRYRAMLRALDMEALAL